jgi:hypothetical protein
VEDKSFKVFQSQFASSIRFSLAQKEIDARASYDVEKHQRRDSALLLSLGYMQAYERNTSCGVG